MASLQSSIAIFGTLSANLWRKILIMQFNTGHCLSLNGKVFSISFISKKNKNGEY